MAHRPNQDYLGVQVQVSWRLQVKFNKFFTHDWRLVCDGSFVERWAGFQVRTLRRLGCLFLAAELSHLCET